MNEIILKGLKKLAVAGSPVFHSKSPELFNYFSGYKNKNIIYSRICTNSAQDLFSIIKSLDFLGLNITSPLKTSIIPFLDEISDDAKKINSVNTIIKEDNKYIGHNTDHIGVVKSFELSGINVKGKKCLVLGTGGAGRAAVYGLLNAGANITICNRTLEKAKKASTHFKCSYIPIDEINYRIKEFNIIISTIPNNSETISNLTMNKNQILLTADYKNELELNNGIEKPRIINGLLWLIFQGAASFKLFTGSEAEKIDLKKLQILLRRKHKKSKTSFIGFSGSGKTTIVKELNKASSIDIDEEIENKTKISISEIFKQKGEQFFRNIERPLLRKFILDSKTKLISCGGGILLNKKNSELLTKQTNIFWLWSPLDIIKTRIIDQSRPLLETSEDLESLFIEREETYLKAADMIIPNTGNKDEISNIIDILKKEI